MSAPPYSGQEGQGDSLPEDDDIFWYYIFNSPTLFSKLFLIIIQNKSTSISLANIICMNPASSYAIIFHQFINFINFHQFHQSLKMCFFVYPASAVAMKWLHQSSFYVHDKIA